MAMFMPLTPRSSPAACFGKVGSTLSAASLYSCSRSFSFFSCAFSCWSCASSASRAGSVVADACCSSSSPTLAAGSGACSLMACATHFLSLSSKAGPCVDRYEGIEKLGLGDAAKGTEGDAAMERADDQSDQVSSFE